jgi:uncharacterized BrkB/YihY/UPF0761 family membrane protein
MKRLKRLVGEIDRWQRHSRVAGPAYGVIRKFSDDQANLLVVSLGWYGFLAIYPLLLVVVTVLGFIGVSSLGHGLVNTLHQFPVIGSEFNPGTGGSNLHGSVPALVIGVVGLIYGAQGVTQNAEQAMSEVWNIPQFKRPGFGSRLARSLLALIIIGGAFVVNALVGSIAAGYGHAFVLRALIIVALLAINVGLYLAAFRVLTEKQIDTGALIPGAILGGIGFTLLITVGAGLVQHQLRHSTATYGAFASVIGVVTFLLLLAKLSIYSAELNPVLARQLWPRALPTCPPTDADNQVLHDLAHQQRRRPDQRIGVGFDPHSPQEAEIDAQQPDDDARQPELSHGDQIDPPGERK